MQTRLALTSLRFSLGYIQSRKLKSLYGARNLFQEPSLELSSQAILAGGQAGQYETLCLLGSKSSKRDLSYRHSAQRGHIDRHFDGTVSRDMLMTIFVLLEY
jgi:hypothetical protein